MRHWFIALAALVMIGACTRVQEVERAGDIQLVQADAAVQARAIAYQLAAAPSDDSLPRITILRGTTCELGSQRATRTSQFAIADREYANVFQDEFRRAGYRTLDAVAADISADARGSAPDFRIVGVMSKVRMNVCLPAADLGDIYTGKGEASMAVEWRLHAAGRKDAIYTTTQLGYAKVDEVIPAVARELLRATFARAIHGLLADQGFRQAMRAPAP